MKKILTLMLAFAMLLGVTACGTEAGKEPDKSAGLEGSLEDILAKIYETADVDDNFKEWAKEGTQVVEITAENAEYHLGSADIEYEEAIVSDPLMMPSAYALCLVRVKEVEAVKAVIKKKANPQKWICVGVDPENVIVDSIGDVIFLVMSDDQAVALHDAFKGLQG